MRSACLTQSMTRIIHRLGRQAVHPLIALSCLILALNAFPAWTESVIRVDLGDLPQRTMHRLLEGDFDILAHGRDWVDVLVDDAEKLTLADMGVRSTTRIPDARAFEHDLRGRDYFDHFHDYDEILEELMRVVQDHGSVVKLLDIGDSWEKIQGSADRDIWAVKISDNVELDEPDEAEVLIMANLHAREIITPEIALYLLNYLVEGYGTDPRITDLVNNRQIWIIPSCNPDGLDHVHDTDIWWRKNRRNNGDGTFGVDLNRNWGYEWGYDDTGSSPSTWSETYRGMGPFSEPETQALRDFFETHAFVISLSFHSYGNWWLYPWGYIPEDTPDHPVFVAIADSCVAYNGYDPGNSASGTIYPTNGDSDDWIYGEQTTKYKTYGFTPECGGDADGFHPDTTRVMPLILENIGPCLYVIEAAEQYAPRPVIAHAPLSDTEDLSGPYPVVAQITPSLWPIDLSSPTLHYRWDGGVFAEVSLIPGSQPDDFEGVIPGPGQSGTYEYYLSAADSIGRVARLPAAAPDSLFSFAVGMDAVPPVIVHVPLGDQPTQAAPFPVQAIVTDNVGIDSAWVEFSVNGSPPTLNPLLPQEQDTYSGFINPTTPVEGDTVEYRLIARDAAAGQNTSTHPAQGYHRFAVSQGYRFDFEASDGGFAVSAGQDWQWGHPTSGPGNAHSGQNTWATNLAGTYRDNSNSCLDTPPLVLTNAVSAILTFWHWYRMEYSDGVYWDGGNVKISVDGGATFQVIYPEGGYDGTATNTANPLYGQPVFGGPPSTGNFWHQETFDLSSYANNTVIVRFHFGSDAYLTDIGWYIDDVVMTTPQSTIPLFRNTVQLQNTADTAGPYVVTSEITDDGGIAGASLLYRLVDSRFAMVPMHLASGVTYLGEIPGHPVGSTIEYFLRAADIDGSVVTDPPCAPDSLFAFSVVDQPQQLGPLPASLFFSGEEGGSLCDTLLIQNLGLIPLAFAIFDSCVGEAQSGMSDIITDPLGDVSAACPDVVALRAGIQADAVVFQVVLAPGRPETTFTIISLDLDQNPDTGARPPAFGLGSPYHDVGAEVDIIIDPTNLYGAQYGITTPSAIVIASDAVIGAYPLDIDPNEIGFSLPLATLADDGSMNLCLLAFSDYASFSEVDFVPDRGHGVIGSCGNALWLSADPDSGSVPGEQTTPVIITADAHYLMAGQYEALLYVATNDPTAPVTAIPVTFQVASLSGDSPLELPARLTVHAAPNPFDCDVALFIGLPQEGWVTLRVYDLLGRRIRTLQDGVLSAGWHEASWKGDDDSGRTVASGLYIGRVVTPRGVGTLRMVKKR
ncbi:immune inhibitor A [Candidatus Fermentibacteria bacterium]|nr:immune inhibitor A [Candidatus Fermentibacteria bacterium]